MIFAGCDHHVNRKGRAFNLVLLCPCMQATHTDLSELTISLWQSMKDACN